MERNLLTPRDTVVPEEYPELTQYVDAINKSMWFHNKWNFQADINDINHKLTKPERSAVINCLLCISQVEVKVKRFWADIFRMFPKPEIDAVGVSFAESEVRHARAYRKLIEVLKLDSMFKDLDFVPQVVGRIEYLKKYISAKKKGDIESFAYSLILFSLLVENSSLFGQFSIVKVIAEKTNSLKDIDNVIIDTSKEENIHALFGCNLIKIIKEENPEVFTTAFYNRIISSVKEAYKAEENLLDFIFTEGELPYLSKNDVSNYIKKRMNTSLEMIDMDTVFVIEEDKLEKFKTFDIEQDVTIHVDFFHKKSPNYNKNSRVVDQNDLF